MRRILVDHARKVQSLKRGGHWKQLQLDDECTFRLNQDEDVVALDELLSLLSTLNERQARIVELRFFGGLTMQKFPRNWILVYEPSSKTGPWAWIRRELKKDRTSASATQKIESEIKPLRRNLDDS